MMDASWRPEKFRYVQDGRCGGGGDRCAGSEMSGYGCSHVSGIAGVFTESTEWHVWYC